MGRENSTFYRYANLLFAQIRRKNSIPSSWLKLPLKATLSWLYFLRHWVERPLAINRSETSNVWTNLWFIIFRRWWIQNCCRKRRKFVSKQDKLTAICHEHPSRHENTIKMNSPKCLERQNLTALIVDAIICIFSKFTSPSMLVLLPSCANVISFNSNGMKGMTGGWSFPTDILHDAMSSGDFQVDS